MTVMRRKPLLKISILLLISIAVSTMANWALSMLVASTMAEPQKGKVEIQTTKVTAKIPTLTPLGDSKASQTKGGITISIAPVEYKLENNYVSRERVVQPSFKESILKPKDAATLVERTCLPTSRIVPDRLRFQVTVSNQLPRVFHGAGLVMQLNLNGKLIQTDAKGYSDFANALIPPRSQQQFEIYGPDLNTLPDIAPLTVAFYDVVTNVDAAGNASEKQNFEWDFQYAVQVKEEQKEVPSPDRLWTAPGKALPKCVVGSSLAPQ